MLVGCFFPLAHRAAIHHDARAAEPRDTDEPRVVCKHAVALEERRDDAEARASARLLLPVCCLPIVPPCTMMPGRLSRAKPTSLAAAMLSLVPRSSRCMLHGLLSHHTEPAAADLRLSLSQRVCAK